MILVALPFVGIVGLASTSLADASATGWQPMLMGDEWLRCLLVIPIIAVVPLALAVGARRHAAPTNFRQARSLVGLLAGDLMPRAMPCIAPPILCHSSPGGTVAPSCCAHSRARCSARACCGGNPTSVLSEP